MDNKIGSHPHYSTSKAANVQRLRTLL